MSRLIGQRRAETLLARVLARDRVGHAYLFVGPSGTGKSTAAELFARAVNCLRQPAYEKTADAWRLAPCGECESCRRIAAGTHPEVMVVRPASRTGQNISVEQAREIRRNAVLRPKLASRRIYILPNAEALNEDSANALLKTLEEPSDFACLILCAPNPSQVLPTIRSRCQLIRFGLAPPPELAEALSASGTAPEMAAVLARASGGRPGLAFTWARDRTARERRGRVLDLFFQAVAAQHRARRNPAAGVLCFRLAEQFRSLAGSDREEGDEPARPVRMLHKENLDPALAYLRDLLLLAGGGDPQLVHNQDRSVELRDLAQASAPERVLADVEAVREAQQLLDRNVSPQLVLERMFWALIAGKEART